MAWNVNLPDAEFYSVDDPGLGQVVADVMKQPLVAIDTETTGLTVWRDLPLFFSLSWGNRRMCLPSEALPRFQAAFQDPDKEWVFANAKFDLHMLANAGIYIAGRILDTQVMHALLYEAQPHSLDHMGNQILGWSWKDMFETWDKRNQPNVGDFIMGLFHNDRRRLVEYASNDAFGTLRIYEKLSVELKQTNIYSLYPERYKTLWDYFFKVESPFTRVLWKCERNGILIDAPYLEDISRRVGKEMNTVERDLTREIGYAINMASPKQLREYFFDKLHLRPLSFTEGGKSGVKLPRVDDDFLKHYAGQVPAARLMLLYREMAKLKGTYADGLPRFFDRHGRIHTRFNQDVARCLPAGELVLTNRGYLPAEQVIVGDLVIAHTGKPRRVTECSVHAPTPIYTVRLSNGLELRTTGHHQYRVGDGWVRADQLENGMSVSVHSHPEHWKPVKGWPFDVSSWGRVMNRFTGRLRALQPKGDWGHLKVSLARNGAQERGEDRKDFSVHRLVIEAFGNEGGGEVRHLNGIAWDNTAGNLCYGTSSENKQDALKHGTMSPRLAGRTVLTEADVEEIRSAELRGQPPSSTSKMTFEIAEEIREERKKGTSVDALAQKHDVSLQSIYYIVNNKTWTKPGEGVTAADLAERFGVSEGYIREIRSGAKWKDQSYIEGSFATFFNALVISVVVEAPEVTYGLTVEEDHSHITGGIVTHNTGRLSSSEPNLQNIPNAEADEHKVRAAFIAPPGMDLIAVDYQALEMRLLAAAAMETSMIEVFNKGWDIHMGNASMVYNLPYDDIKAAKKKKDNKEPLTDYDKKCLKARADVKAVSFGLNYGMKEKLLAKNLGCTKEEALELMGKYMGRYPAVQKFYEEAIQESRKSGYAYTVLGRRRFLPEIISYSQYDRWQAERQATNLQIQGSAADAAKMAMILIDDAQVEQKYGARMLLQIHDEIVFECPEETADEALKEISMWMEHPFPTDLAVALTVSGGRAKNWAEAK